MEFYDVIKERRSVRSYTSESICEDALKRIADAVMWAPSACNIQPCTFRVVFNEKLRKKIYSCYPKKWLLAAPAIVLAIGNTKSAWKRLNGDSNISLDLGIAMEHFVLAAQAEGLSTCWIGAYSIQKMGEELGIMEPNRVLAISPLGKANKIPPTPKRKAAEETVIIIR